MCNAYFAAVACLVAGCGIEPSESAQPSSESKTPSLRELIPGDVSYSLTERDSVPGVKRALDVELSREVSEETLRAIANVLHADTDEHYDRTFICYYLPGMTIGAGAWATTHFDPTLEVKIHGMTAEEVEELTSSVREEDDREVLGQWLDKTPYVGGTISIYRDGEGYVLEQKFPDRSNMRKELRRHVVSAGQRFDPIERSSTGDHWVINKRGDLEIRDQEGLITTARAN